MLGAGLFSFSILSVVCLKQVPHGGAKLVAQLIFLGKAMLSCAAWGKASLISKNAFKGSVILMKQS